MQAWWISMTIIEKIFACIAIPSTLVLLIQTILLVFGLGDDGDADIDINAGSASGVPSGDLSADMDVDLDGDGLADVSAGGGFHLFTFKGLIAFLAVMGWTGYTMLRAGVSVPISLVVSTLAGVAIMFLIALAFYFFAKLQSNGNIDIRNAIGKSGNVYIPIPASRDGFGKVNIVVQERLCEYDAVTDEEEKIKFGAEVVVIGISGLNTLVVKRK
ncbi:MAG: hypothetical protein IJF55_00755 [Clostridia bacterium]|nr:hypothetical protein [Clostridia bacterium]